MRFLLRQPEDVKRPSLFWRTSAVFVMLSQLLLCDSALAQVTSPSIVAVTVSPAGNACTANMPLKLFIPSGTLFSCQSGTYGQVGGGGNTTSTALTANSLPKASAANAIVNSLFTDSGTAGAYTGTAGFSAPFIITPAGTGGNPSLTSNVDATTGWHYPTTSQAEWTAGGFDQILWASGFVGLRSTVNIRWNSAGPATSGNDTGLSRSAAGIVSVDTTANGNGLGTLKVASVLPGVIYSAAGTAVPSCVTGLKGEKAVVSDATGAPPTFMSTYTTGGSTVAAVMCNGTNWVTY